ncbi:MAG: SUMF1/EgtB/PvdO family nonheme iron enzyme, partial [Planctomycetes bacterium]|nr:SUMF1/EgtB/PvdO family nonheme iron enzyme [Planctomycetota bacterium]
LQAVLTDFGLARPLDGDGLTRTGSFLGTYAYSSPEQIDGERARLTERSDLYSLGVTLYELLTLRRPFDGDSGSEIRKQQEQDRVVPPGRFNPHIPRDLGAIVRKSVRSDPRDRYESAQAFALDLERFLGGHAVHARPLPWHRVTWRWCGRNRIATALIATFVISSILVTWFALDARSNYDRFRNLLVGARLDALELRMRSSRFDVLEARASFARLGPDEDVETKPIRTSSAMIQDLLEEARSILAELPRMKSVLEELRMDAEPSPRTTVRSPQRPPHALIDSLQANRQHLTRLRLELEMYASSDMTPDDVSRATERIGFLEQLTQDAARTIAASDATNIPERDEQLLFDLLERDIVRIERFRDEILPDLEDRLDHAVQLRRDAEDDQQSAIWRSVAERLRTDPRFPDLDLVRQEDLVPLGPDPVTRLEEFAHSPSGTVPSRDPEGNLRLDGSSAIVFVLLPAGKQRIRFGPGQTAMREFPAFMIGKHELSRRQWITLAGRTPELELHRHTMSDLRNLSETHLDKPVNSVSWPLARLLLGKWGLEFPGSAEWEYACRAGTETVINTGRTLESLIGHENLRDIDYGGESGPDGPRGVFPIRDGYAGLAPIHALKPNGFGLHSMHGNVREWCGDADADPYRAVVNLHRILRGGGWNTTSDTGFYSDAVDWVIPSSTARDVGVRAVYRLREIAHE